MTGGHPGLGVHQNGGVHAHVIGAFLYELLPPGLFHVVFEFHTQGAVVPGVGETAVDLASGENESSVLAQGNDLVHCGFGHGFHLLYGELNLFILIQL